MRKVILFLFMTLTAASCVGHVPEIENPEHDSEDVICAFSVVVDVPQRVKESRSSFSDEELDKITDLNVFIYHEGILLGNYSSYHTDMSSLMLAFPYDRDGFNIYMLGNVGKIEAPFHEKDIINLRYVAESYDQFHSKGFPIANVFADYRKGELAVFRLKRLVGQYDIMVRSSAVSAVYDVKDVRLLNCALDMYPFAPDMKATVFTRDGNYGESPQGDSLTEDDIRALNSGESVSLYLVENLQGELLPGNTDRRKKIPSSLESIDPGRAGSCTYLEVTADITTQSAKYTDGKYRFYLGQNQTTDFSIKRSTLYDVTLDFTQNMVSEEEWRIEVGDPEVNDMTLSKTEAHVVKGIGDHILISGPKVRVENCDFDGLYHVLEDVVIDGREYQKLSFVTDKDIVGMYDWGMDYTGLAHKYDVFIETEELYNGRPLVKKSLSVYVHDRLFPVFLRMGSTGKDAPYQIEAVTDAPVNADFTVYAILNADVGKTGKVRTYDTSASANVISGDGYRCCCAGFPTLYNSGQSQDVYFREMHVILSGMENEYGDAMELYMGDGGEVYWGPGSGRYPEKFADLAEDSSIALYSTHSCSISGCVNIRVNSGNTLLFLMAPEGRTCNTVVTTGTSNSLKYDLIDYNRGNYMPFYVANGDLKYAYPVKLLDESAKYMDDSARKSVIYQMPGPGRDVFYPNGVRWGGISEGTPGNIHKFGYTAGLVKQFLGNIHTWQIYQTYECDFFMTVNGCTSWPGASNLASGFKLDYNL